MDISIIIVNYNGKDIIQDCLDSILSSDTTYQVEIIVVDNQSQDNSIELLEQYQSSITLLKNTDNRGFSKANNQGIKCARGQYVWLLNNDTVLFKDTIQKLLDYYEKNPEIGALMPKLLNKDQTLQYPGGILGSWKYRGQKPTSVSFISGAAFLTTAKVLESVGGLDENYFFYNEDLDLSKEILKKSKKLIYYPGAQIIHLGGASTATRKPASVIEGYRGGLYFCYKQYPRPIFHIYRFVLLLDIIPRWVLNKIGSIVNPSKKEMAKAYEKVLRISLFQDIVIHK